MIIILTISRSGSSMIASIFDAHGLEIGEIDAENRFGYRQYENLTVRAKVNHLCYADGSDNARMKRFKNGYSFDDVQDIFTRYQPDGRWLYKCGVVDWPVLANLDAKFVLVWRNLESIVSSQVAKSHFDRQMARIVVQAQQRVIQRLAHDYGFPIVDADEVMAGNYESLQAAFDYCDLIFDPELADQMIDVDKWRH